jgi:6-pyruvoyltetrahydropterin/6-carboxytetrahydropterin synthase
MAHYLLSAEAGFSAAHTLPGVDKCDRLHGHNWRLRLTVQVDEEALERTGMGVDFRMIEDIARQAVADFDHRYLNEMEPFRRYAPSAERIAKVVFTRAAEHLGERAPAASLVEVEVSELPEYRVVYRP